VAGLPVLYGLNRDELERLRELVILFLHEKSLEAAGGLELTEAMRLRIAAQACLPILNLGLDYYQGWVTVIVYPGGFLARHQYADSAGIVHTVQRPLIGEAWEQGPLILSWEDIEAASTLTGFNVVIHELAHKLDMLNGVANGMPPLHATMQVEEWSWVFGTAYEDCCQGLETVLDPYAAESPAEFFAIVSEAFFEIPGVLNTVYPAVYEQLRAFYRQDPRRRLGPWTISHCG